MSGGESLVADSLFFDRFRVLDSAREANCAKFFCRAHSRNMMASTCAMNAAVRKFCARARRVRRILTREKCLFHRRFFNSARVLAMLRRASSKIIWRAWCARVAQQRRASIARRTRFVKRDAVFFVVL